MAIQIYRKLLKSSHFVRDLTVSLDFAILGGIRVFAPVIWYGIVIWKPADHRPHRRLHTLLEIRVSFQISSLDPNYRAISDVYL